jgi:chemotaxis protein MotB
VAKAGAPKRKKRAEEPEKAPNHERWLLTYSDMITLLMVFFVVMYAMS